MKKVLAFLSAAVVAHGFSAVAGLLLTRWLSIDEYAIYTAVVLLAAAMTILTTGGINIAFTSMVGRIWPNRTRAAQILAASVNERLLLSAIVLPLFLGASVWLLLKAGASGWVVAALLALLIGQWFFDMQSRITDQILLYAKRAVGLQMLDTGLAFLRLVAVLGLQVFGALSIIAVTALGVIGAALRVPFVQRWTKSELPSKPPIDLERDRKEIRAVTIRQMPVELFYCFESQISIYILALAGTTTALASFGALGRIAQLFVPVSMIVSAYAIPRFSQVKEDVFSSFFKWSLLGLIPSLGLVAIAALAPWLLLLLIGPNYAGLEKQVLITCIGSASFMFANTARRLAAHRGWNRWVMLQIPVFLTWCVISPTFLDLKTLDGVLWFQLGLPLALIVATAADLLAVYLKRDDFA